MRTTRRCLLSLLIAGVSAALFAQAPDFTRGVNLTGWFQAGSAHSIQFTRYTKTDFEPGLQCGPVAHQSALYDVRSAGLYTGPVVPEFPGPGRAVG